MTHLMILPPPPVDQHDNALMVLNASSTGEIHVARSFAWNSLYNLLSQVFVLGLAFLTVPFIIAHIGNDRFGLLSILWMVIGYFSFLDLGVGQATTRFMAESIAKGEREHASRVLRAAIMLGLLLSVVSNLLLIGFASLGADRLLNIPISLSVEASHSLVLLGLCLPAVILQGLLRSIPLAFNRFDIVNLIQILSGFLQWGGAVLIILVGGGFLGVVILTVCVRYVTSALYLVLALRFLPEIRRSDYRPSKTIVVELLSFGGWTTISQMISPILFFLERMFIVNVLSLAWVAYYVAPNDAMMRLVVFASSVSFTLYLFLSARWGDETGMIEGKLKYLRSVKYTYILMLPILALIGVFSKDILLLWLGAEFAEKSAFILMTFSCGMVVYSMSQLPNAVLLGLGRPDLAAKLLLIELPLYCAICYAFTSWYGIFGTSLAWFLRILAEGAFLFLAARKLMAHVPLRFDYSFFWKSLLMVAVGAGGVLVPANIGSAPIVLKTILALFFLATYSVGTWFFSFDDRDKALITLLKGRFPPRLGIY